MVAKEVIEKEKVTTVKSKLLSSTNSPSTFDSLYGFLEINVSPLL
jgi:hypothetical protein